MTEPTDRDDIADEIEQAISDSLDMDWQPKWAVAGIMEIFDRERAHDAARIAELEAVCRENVIGWENAVEMGLLPARHHMSAKILADENRRALRSNTDTTQGEEND